MENREEASNVVTIDHTLGGSRLKCGQFSQTRSFIASKPKSLGALGNPDNQARDSALPFKLRPSKDATALFFFSFIAKQL